MFTLRNKIGNVHRVVKTERERKALIEDGYVDVDAEKAEAEAKAAEEAARKKAEAEAKKAAKEAEKAAKEAAANKAGDGK